MSPLTGPAQASRDHARLPRLQGWLLWLYRLAWAVLALACLVVLGLSLLDGEAHPAVTMLRLVKGAAVLAVAVILLRRRSGDPVAGLLCLSFLIWTITSSFDFASAPVLPLLLDRVRFLLFALALLLFPDGDWRPRWTRAAGAASCCVFTLGIAETLQLVSTQLFLPFAIGCVVAAVGSLIVRFRTAQSDALRHQLRWVALGLVSGIGMILLARAGAAVSGVGQASGLAVVWEAMFQSGIVAIALGFLVSLLRYRLFDAESAISRSAGYALLTLALVGTFAGTEALIERVGQMYLGMGIGDVSAAAAAAVAAVLLNPIHGRVSSWAEQRFQRDLVLLKQDVPALLDHLSLTAAPDRLAASVLARINAAINATSSAVLLDGSVIARQGSETTDAMGPSIRLEMPCAGCKRAGSLLIGRRPDGSRPASDELAAVRSILPAFRHALDASIALETLRADIRRAQADIDALGRSWSADATATRRPNSPASLGLR